MDLWRACEEDNLERIRHLIQDGQDVNITDAYGRTPLMVAAVKGLDQLLLKLIRAGASVSAKNKWQQSALYLASREGHSSAVSTLIQAEADVNVQDEDGTTPLMEAAQRGHDQVVQEFIRVGAVVIAKNYTQQSALHIASKEGHHRVVKSLIEAGANTNEHDELGRTHLMFAAHRGHDQVVHKLIRAGTSVQARDNTKQSALHYASKGGHPSVVKTLFEADVNVNEPDRYGRTPLMSAIEGGHEQVVHELIRTGASVVAKNNSKRTALHYACRGGHPSVVKALIEAGANSSEQDQNGTTPLIDAAAMGHDRVVHELIKAGSNVAVKTNTKRTALHYASWGGHPSVVGILIEAGACISAQDEDGTTALMFAAVGGHEEVVHELIRQGGNVTAKDKWQQTALYLASREGHSDTVKTLTAAKSDVHEPDEDGITPLMVAVCGDHDRVVRELIRAGASHAHQTSIRKCFRDRLVAAGSTALHFAASCNSIKSGVLLLEAGADITVRNKDSKSPLDFASLDFLQTIQRAHSLSTKRTVAVIGNTEHGKSTLIKALQAEGNNQFKKFTNRFRKVQDIRHRTAGIEAVQFASHKYGLTLFYDFAGQLYYHGPHQSFLAAMLNKPGMLVSLLLLVKATDEADVITQQVVHWLQPLSLTSVASTLQVILVGSFLDQVKSKGDAFEKLLRCTQSMQEDLHFNIQGPCLLDCRKPESEGISQICTFLQEFQPPILNSITFAYNLRWLLVQLQNAFCVPAITLDTFQSWLLDEAILHPRHLPQPEKLCHDIMAVGQALFVPNRNDFSRSWLILDLQSILHNVYGTLFSRSPSKVNKFGLLHFSQLTNLFPMLDPEMLQEILISLEFCIQVNVLLLPEELLKLTAMDEEYGWLYFPALVSARPPDVFPQDSEPEKLHWMCWQLKTAEKFFISSHLLQTIILRLAANHVFTHELSPSVREHCCSVWVNGLSWMSTKGVDVAVQISDSSVVQVVGRRKTCSEKLYQYMSIVIRDVIRTTAQLSPKLEATSYIVHPYTSTILDDPKAFSPDSLYPISSIAHCISKGDEHVLSREGKTGHPHRMRLAELFGGWTPSPSIVQDMNFQRMPQSVFTGSTSEASVPMQKLKVTDAVIDINSNPTLRDLDELVVGQVAHMEDRFPLHLGVQSCVIEAAKKNHPNDCERALREILDKWLKGARNTGNDVRTWHTVLRALEKSRMTELVEELKIKWF